MKPDVKTKSFKRPTINKLAVGSYFHSHSCGGERGAGVFCTGVLAMDGGGRQRRTVSWETEAAGELSDPVFPAHFFQFHPPVLEPDFDLPVSEVHTTADLQATLSSQVHVEEKLLLQLQSLVLRVGAALLSTTLCCEPVSRAFHFSISYKWKLVKVLGNRCYKRHQIKCPMFVRNDERITFRIPL